MRSILTIAISCLFFMGTTTFAADKVKKTTAAEPKLLFIINANQSQFSHVGGKQYQLTIPHTAMQSVHAFSAPPNHLSFPMTPEAYRKFVYSGANSFTQDPPNVILNWPQQNKKAVYTLNKHQVFDDKIIYTLTQIGPDAVLVKETAGPVMLLVDSRGCKTTMGVLKCIGGAGRLDGIACRSYVNLPTCPPERPAPSRCASPFGEIACRTGASNWHGIPCRYYLRFPPC